MIQVGRFESLAKCGQGKIERCGAGFVATRMRGVRQVRLGDREHTPKPAETVKEYRSSCLQHVALLKGWSGAISLLTR